MTANQIAFQNYLENARHNVVGEKESHRHNFTTEVETGRHNLSTEAETTRHNTVFELETGRHNVTTENETSRHNVATENAALSNLAFNYAQLAQNRDIAYKNLDLGVHHLNLDISKQDEVERHNSVVEMHNLLNFNELERHNKANELQAKNNLQFSATQLEEAVRHNEETETISWFSNLLKAPAAIEDLVSIPSNAAGSFLKGFIGG